ncbi:MAG: lytic murein transglycosylase [Pseudomonadota bacterium]
MATLVGAATLSPTPNPPKPEIRVSSAKEEAFQNWVASYKRQAAARGVPQRVLDQAFRAVRYNEEVIEKDRNQAEFSLAIWDYLGRIVSDEQVRNGRAALRRHRRSLQAIEDRYGVDKEVVVAVWGAETRYGETRGDISVVEATATLAFDGRRGRFFRSQLDETINILIRGDTTARNLKGSWAGAMGHTQFIPSSYRAYAVDFDGDGRRDIWANDPTDALASTAAYLKRFGWRQGQPVAVEVRLSKGADVSLARRSFVLSPAQWAARGVTGLDGKPLPNYGQASLFLPAGAAGPAFLTFNNFRVLERYNAAEAYVLAVGNLALRVGGAGPIQGSWPVGSRPLKRAEIQELQERLTAAGFSTQGADGLMGPNTTNAIRQYQRARGLKVDGFASLDLLADLKR